MSANILRLLILLIIPFNLGACSRILPVPGGSETVNKDFYDSDNELKQLVSEIKEGQSKAQVFAHLRRVEDDFILLTRDEIMSTLYGGQRLEFTQVSTNPLTERSFLKDFKGYKLIYKAVKRKHGIHTPISMRTKEGGCSYVATFIFKNGILYEDPVLSGGMVDSTTTKTVFDYLSPKNALGQFGI